MDSNCKHLHAFYNDARTIRHYSNARYSKHSKKKKNNIETFTTTIMVIYEVRKKVTVNPNGNKTKRGKES